MSDPMQPCPLSGRELEVLALLASGMVYKEIAAELTLSVSTIRTHLHGIYGKLGVVDRAQAVLIATANRWLTWERGVRKATSAPTTRATGRKDPAPRDLGAVARTAREVEAITRRWMANHLPAERPEGDFTIRVGVPPLPRMSRETGPTWPLPFKARVNPEGSDSGAPSLSAEQVRERAEGQLADRKRGNPSTDRLEGTRHKPPAPWPLTRVPARVRGAG